jgi:hypothetical protein
MPEETQKPLQRHRECGLPSAEGEITPTGVRTLVDSLHAAQAEAADLRSRFEVELFQQTEKVRVENAALAHLVTELRGALEQSDKRLCDHHASDNIERLYLAGLGGVCQVCAAEPDVFERNAAALALPLPEAAKRASENAKVLDAYRRLYGEAMLEIAGLKREGATPAEREFLDAALVFATAKATINDQADRYKTALAALQAARRKS